MKLEVRALGGVERANIEIDKVALVVGATGAGKTSIADAARAAVTNDWHIRGITTKSRLGGVVHTGFETGSAKISIGDAYAQIRFPGTEYETASDDNGITLFSSEVAAGLANPLAEDVRKRTQFFIEILAAHPTEKDVMTTLEDKGLTAQQAGQVWKRIKESNFDDALSHYSTRATEIKGQWEGVAKDRWGTRKGENFLPDGWDEELTDASEQSLEAEIATSKKKLEELIAETAVSAERRGQLEEAAGRLDNLKKQRGKLLKVAADQKENVARAEEALRKLPEPEQEPKTVDCPHCGAASKVEVVSGEITLSADFEPVSAEVNEKRSQAQEEAREALAAQRQALTEVDGQVTQCDRLLRTAEEASEQLDNLPPTGELDEAEVNAAREAVGASELRLAKFKQKKEADICHRSIMLNLSVVEELKPEGLRKRKLAGAIDEFNKSSMAPLNNAIEGVRCFFDAGTMDPMMESSRGIRHYRLLSRGEKLLFQATLQFAVAEKDGSSLVIIDDADAVTGDLRSGLVKMALAAPSPSIICMAVRAPEQVPDLSKTKKGHTYWVQDKTATEVGE